MRRWEFISYSPFPPIPECRYQTTGPSTDLAVVLGDYGPDVAGSHPAEVNLGVFPADVPKHGIAGSVLHQGRSILTPSVNQLQYSSILKAIRCLFLTVFTHCPIDRCPLSFLLQSLFTYVSYHAQWQWVVNSMLKSFFLSCMAPPRAQ